MALINKDFKLIYNSAVYVVSTSIQLLLIPSAVQCTYTIMRPVWSLCDCAEVCMQSLEVSAECWQVDSLWARGLHWLQNPFFHLELLIHHREPCPAVSLWIYSTAPAISTNKMPYFLQCVSEAFSDEIVKREFIKTVGTALFVWVKGKKDEGKGKFSSNRSKNPQLHLGRHCQAVMSERERNWSWNCHRTCKTFQHGSGKW